MRGDSGRSSRSSKAKSPTHRHGNEHGGWARDAAHTLQGNALLGEEGRVLSETGKEGVEEVLPGRPALGPAQELALHGLRR